MPFNFGDYRSTPSSIKLNGPILDYIKHPVNASEQNNRTVVFDTEVLVTFVGTGEVAEGTYTFKWYLDDVELKDSSDTNVTIFNSGASSQLTISDIDYTFEGREVYVVSSYIPASNEGQLNNPNLKSNVVTIDALNELEITTQPQDFVGAEKLTAVFNVAGRSLPTNNPQRISYQWQMNNRDLFDGLITGQDINKYGLTASVGSPKFTVTADDGSESFTIDWTQTSSFKSFTPGKTYTIVPSETIETKVFAQGGGGGRSGDKNVVGSAGGVASGYVTFNKGQTYKLQVGERGEGGKKIYSKSSVTHRYNERTRVTTSIDTTADITVKPINENTTISTTANDCGSVDYTKRHYQVTFAIPMADANYDVDFTSLGKYSASLRAGVFTVIGIREKTTKGFKIWFCNGNPNGGYSFTDFIRSFEFVLVGMRGDTTQDGEGGLPGGGSNTLPDSVIRNTAGGGGGYTGLFQSTVSHSNTMIIAGGGGGSSVALSVGGDGGLILNAGSTSASGSDSSPVEDPGRPFQAVYTTPGTYSWTAPEGVTSVCAVCVGGGQRGKNNNGGGGGGLGWRNNMPVTPGNSYTVVVGDEGETSYFNNPSTVSGQGGDSGRGFTGQGGGRGGSGGGGGGLGNFGAHPGGGGAGGYSGDGGNGGYGLSPSPGTPGQGGGGGGGAGFFAGGGGGVGLLGEGPSGARGEGVQGTRDNGGQGGSGGGRGAPFSWQALEPGQSSTGGGLYGGGGGTSRVYGRFGGTGAVRIIWGDGRSFPSTNTEDKFGIYPMSGEGGTPSSGGEGGGATATRGDDGSALRGGDGSNGAGGGGGGYYGGGGGGKSELIGGGGGGSSFINFLLVTANDQNITTKDYSPNVEGDGSFNISLIGDDIPLSTRVIVSGANSSQLSLYSEQGGFGSNVRCALSSQNTFNSPLYSETASYQVIDNRPILIVEAIDTTNSWVERTRTNLENISTVELTSETFGSSYKIIQFYSEESDFNLDIDIKASAGGNERTFVGGQGGTSKIRINIKKNVEYTMIGLAENSAIFLYEKARLVAVVGKGGDAGRRGNGGAGGGVNVDGIRGEGTRPGSGGVRPVSGSLTSRGIYGSTVDSGTVDLYPEDTIASDQSGGRTVSCSKGLYYINRGFSPCEDISTSGQRFIDQNGVVYSQSSQILRGFKAGYSVTETGGAGLVDKNRFGRTRSGGDGGHGATGGNGGASNSGGGGGSGYVDDSVTVINTTSGGNPDQVSSVIFSLSPS